MERFIASIPPILSMLRFVYGMKGKDLKRKISRTYLTVFIEEKEHLKADWELGYLLPVQFLNCKTEMLPPKIFPTEVLALK